MRKTENEKKSRKLLFIATALTILAVASVLLTASVLLGTTYGVVFTSVLVIASVLLGTLYIRLLLSSSFHPSNYRCPNPECKKIFHSPLKVRDYSNKKISHIACPECGHDLGCSNIKKALMQTIIENNEEPEVQETRDKIETNFSKPNMQNEKVEAIKMDSPVLETHQEKTSSKINNEDSKKATFEGKEDQKNTAPILSEIQTHMIITQSEKPKALENANSRQESKSPKKGNYKEVSVDKKDRPEGCNNYFGYLWTLPKGAVTPDECYACTRLIDCYKELTF